MSAEQGVGNLCGMGRDNGRGWRGADGRIRVSTKIELDGKLAIDLGKEDPQEATL